MLPPITKTFTNSPDFYVCVLARVSPLLLTGSPSAILGRVGTIIVNPVDGCIEGSPSHVPKKCSKTISPPFTYVNTSSAIMLIIPIGYGMASDLHPPPYPILSKGFDGHPSGEYVTCRFIHNDDMFGFSASRPLNRAVSRDKFSHNNI